ncbi:MAG TPA: hypothetical protein VJH55_03920 [Candidatus Paceibacterota bacterium]
MNTIESWIYSLASQLFSYSLVIIIMLYGFSFLVGKGPKPVNKILIKTAKQLLRYGARALKYALRCIGQFITWFLGICYRGVTAFLRWFWPLLCQGIQAVYRRITT